MTKTPPLPGLEDADVDDITPSEAASTASEAYQVTFSYEEPSYALVRGIESVMYTAIFCVRASSERAAIALATKSFDDAAARSGVSWARVIRATACRRLVDK